MEYLFPLNFIHEMIYDPEASKIQNSIPFQIWKDIEKYKDSVPTIHSFEFCRSTYFSNNVCITYFVLKFYPLKSNLSIPPQN